MDLQKIVKNQERSKLFPRVCTLPYQLSNYLRSLLLFVVRNFATKTKCKLGNFSYFCICFNFLTV